MLRPARPHRLLALLPPLLMAAAVLLGNRTEPYLLGLPFLLACVAGCVVLSSATMALVGALDEAADRRQQAARGGGAAGSGPAGDGGR